MNITIQSALIFLGTFIFYAAGLSWSSAYGVGGSILLLTALFFWRDLRPQRREEKEIVCFFLLVFLLFLLPRIYHHSPARSYDLISRIAAVIPVFLLFCRFPLPQKIWLVLLSLGTLSALLIELVQLQEWQYRFFQQGALNIIQIGDLALLMGFLALIALPNWRERKWLTAFSLCGFLTGILISLMTGSRGGWIAIPPVGLLLITHFFPQQKKIKIYFVCALLLTLVAISFIPNVHYRLREVYLDILAFHHGNAHTSLGARFKLWQISWQLFSEKPFWGYGDVALQQVLNQKKMGGFNHLHNNFFDVAARSGLVGLSGLLLLYFLPLYWFYRRWRAGIQIALAGVVLSLSFSLFSFSQSILRHHSGIIFYCVTLSLVAALTLNSGAKLSACQKEK